MEIDYGIKITVSMLDRRLTHYDSDSVSEVFYSFSNLVVFVVLEEN